MTDDFFRNRLDQMIALRHPLAVLANRMPRQEIEASLAQRWARQVKSGKKIEDLDLFSPLSGVAGGGVSNAGRPRLPKANRIELQQTYAKECQLQGYKATRLGATHMPGSSSACAKSSNASEPSSGDCSAK